MPKQGWWGIANNYCKLTVCSQHYTISCVTTSEYTFITILLMWKLRLKRVKQFPEVPQPARNRGRTPTPEHPEGDGSPPLRLSRLWWVIPGCDLLFFWEDRTPGAPTNHVLNVLIWCHPNLLQNNMRGVNLVGVSKEEIRLAMNWKLLKLGDGYMRVDYTNLYFCMCVEFSIINFFFFLSISSTFFRTWGKIWLNI